MLAEILAIGPGKWQDGQRQPMGLKAGDRVVVSGSAGFDLGEEIKLELGLDTEEASNIFFIRYTDIIAVLQK